MVDPSSDSPATRGAGGVDFRNLEETRCSIPAPRRPRGVSDDGFDSVTSVVLYPGSDCDDEDEPPGIRQSQPPCRSSHFSTQKWRVVGWKGSRCPPLLPRPTQTLKSPWLDVTLQLPPPHSPHSLITAYR
ncbi:hypothetical protein CHARACLAT_024610 [Characodon lateralis]|uniref:Uncharacterized protein n=1 Tax=Characodon lateralis TaxID=208331 RepID=A0ABU7D9L6_9TELE|nr:hypothetical protein [Characodon lateralis]